MQIKPYTENISFELQGKWNNIAYSFLGETKENSKIVLKIISPERLKDCVVTLSGDYISFEYLGLEKKGYISQLSSDSPLKAIANGFKESLINEVHTKNNQLYFSYKLSSTEYFFHIGATGLPIKICNKNGNNQLNFKNVTILK